MKKFIVKELQNLGSERAGHEITAKDFSDAKRKASRMQSFNGTVLVIENENGVRLAYKQGKKWADAV